MLIIWGYSGDSCQRKHTREVWRRESLGKVQEAKNPRCFKNFQCSTDYKSSKSAWMTSAIFKQWFHESFVPQVTSLLNEKALPVKALLLIDNAPSHPNEAELTTENGQISAMFMPPNTIVRCPRSLVDYPRQGCPKTTTTTEIVEKIQRIGQSIKFTHKMPPPTPTQQQHYVGIAEEQQKQVQLYAGQRKHQTKKTEAKAKSVFISSGGSSINITKSHIYYRCAASQ
ncbi:uncharacterized protein LOC128867080 [Anastrepha ludens]|uniref:uncharacterized protein LOC128867080 n=1 Tax=Anastrepha ludens TaxID=28586 RepID=UPI0023AFA440|nr:uncharacterized protein LOC128867080 [Anastrepha ludens]